MKKLWISFVALIILIGTSAFVLNHQNEKMLTPVYWDFIGDPGNPNDIADPEMYILDSDNVADCTTGPKLCEIKASPQVGNEDFPDLSTEDTGARTFRN